MDEGLTELAGSCRGEGAGEDRQTKNELAKRGVSVVEIYLAMGGGCQDAAGDELGFRFMS